MLWLLSSYASSFWQGLFINMGMFLILVLSLNLFNGFTGVFSLGHIGFMALGAYIAAILTLPPEGKLAYLPDLPAWLAPVHLDQMVGPFSLGFLAATLIAGFLVALVAFLVGLVLMRLSGHYVAVATLGFLIIVRVTLFNADAFTRGSRTFSNITAYTDLWWVYAWVVLAVYVVWRIKFSPFGRNMFAQREDRWAAQSIGITMMRPRLLAFVVSAFFTAVAGSLYAHFITSMSPTVFYFDLTFRRDYHVGVGRAGLRERLDHRHGVYRAAGRGAAAGRGRHPALRHEQHHHRRDPPASDYLPTPGAARPERAEPGMALR